LVGIKINAFSQQRKDSQICSIGQTNRSTGVSVVLLLNVHLVMDLTQDVFLATCDITYKVHDCIGNNL